MARPVSFDEAALALLDAAVDPMLWINAMDSVSQYAGATGAVLLPIKGRGPGTPHSPSLNELLDVYFREGWHLKDQRERGINHMRRKGIFVDQDFVTEDELKTSDYYNGFLSKYRANWSAGIGFSNQDDEWCMVLGRGDQHGHFDPNEQADLLRFGPYLNRAAQISRQLAYANATGMLDAFEALECAAFLLDKVGQVVRHNSQANALLGDGLSIAGRQLRSERPSDAGALEKLFSALQVASISGVPLATINRASKRPLVIQGIRLAGLAAGLFSPAASILLVSDTEKKAPPAATAIWQKVFGLSSSETALLPLLEREVPLSEAADAIGISFETARYHLKRIFAKTGTSRQVDLMLLLSRIHPVRR